MLEPIRDSRGQVIGFVEPNGNSTNVYQANTSFAGWSDGVNVYASDGRQIADNPAAIGLLLEGGT
jgi:hypothetical protein